MCVCSLKADLMHIIYYCGHHLAPSMKMSALLSPEGLTDLEISNTAVLGIDPVNFISP